MSGLPVTIRLLDPPCTRSCPTRSRNGRGRAQATGTSVEKLRRRAAEFFSFGTNDLTQTTLGISRDDAAAFLEPYTAKNILPSDPFVTLDQEGVGQLVELAAVRGRATRAGIKLGICGEHDGAPASIGFCERVKLDYVSCSPYRVPNARLAAAQAVISVGSAVDRLRRGTPANGSETSWH